MKKLSLLLALVLALSALTGVFASAQEVSAPGIVETPYGQISGVSENGVNYYKGIPFAKPPVGDLRWAAPEDPEPWEGVFAADTYAPMAMQILSTTDSYGPEFYYDWMDVYPPMSEDCLYLNVVTPEGPAPEGGYPVYVWFHGGASMHGYSWEPEFEPAELVKKGVIVVSAAYRLGVFGFLATPELSASSETGTSGNYGLLDQIKSLEWVQKNIAAFGGDPAKVTIGGQSAGAGAVTAILTSPLAKGLFTGAIMDSNFGALGSRNTLSGQQESGVAYLTEKGYENLSVEELRALPTSDFMNETTEKPEVYGKGFGICLDGYSITENQIDYFQKEGALNGVHILFGSNSGEGNAEFAVSAHDDIMASARESYGSLFDQYDFENLYKGINDAGSTVESLRLRSERGAIQHLLIAEIVSELNPGVGVYPYYFSHWTPGRQEEIRWAWHSSELWYSFKSLRDIPEQRDWEEIDYQIAEDYSTYWANFIKTGNPNGAGVPYWPSVTKENAVFMEMGDTFFLRDNFYADTKLSARDDFMRESIITSNNLQKYFE